MFILITTAMNEYDILVENILFDFQNKEDYTVTRFMNNYLIVGYSNNNFVFEVFTDNLLLKPKIPWKGHVIVIKSFEEAIDNILLQCLPF